MIRALSNKNACISRIDLDSHRGLQGRFRQPGSGDRASPSSEDPRPRGNALACWRRHSCQGSCAPGSRKMQAKLPEEPEPTRKGVERSRSDGQGIITFSPALVSDSSLMPRP